MDIVFFGTPELSAFVLKELHKNNFSIKGVVTQPDRKSGRGLSLTPPPVKELADKLGIKILQSERFDKKLFSDIKDLGGVDLAVVVAFGCYIPTYFIHYLNNKILNIHFSLLPRYRGAAPVARAIMNGEKESGVTIMELNKEMDTGDIVIQKKIMIADGDNTDTLSWKLVKEGTQLLIEHVGDYLEGKIKPLPQSQIAVVPSYAQKLNAEERFIDWSMSALDICNLIRGLYPWPIAESRIGSYTIKFINARVVDLDGAVSDLNAGVVVDVDKKHGFFTVMTGNGLLLVEKVKPSGKKEMDVSSFLNGYALKKGMRFE